jgi:tripartite-type tricarboxylate transporter receptor subunit TctC
MVHVPYRGLPEAHTSVIRQDAVVFMTFYSAGGDLIQSGKLLPLAVTTKERLPMLPNVPTVQEAGVAGYDYQPWFGLFAPAGTSPAILDKINADIATAAKSPDLNGMFGKLGMTLKASDRNTFAQLVKSDAARFAPLFANKK